jgi:hypothetical protein
VSVRQDAAIVQRARLAPRKYRVAGELQADPSRRYALDVQAGGTLEPVSVVLAIRLSDRIITGELHIPAGKWDAPLFEAYWKAQERPS